MKKYWIELNQLNYQNCYRMRCPNCGRVFIMLKLWGVWKGCPSCWTRLNDRKDRINKF